MDGGAALDWDAAAIGYSYSTADMSRLSGMSRNQTKSCLSFSIDRYFL